MANEVEIIIGLLLAVAALAWLATRLDVAYPIFLVIGGLALSFVPGLPRVVLRPDLVFLLFLPPLLYFAGIQTTWRDFKENIRPITLLAVGLVLFTTCAVALAARWLIPDLSWPAAFVLGAIVSPPDAVAATSVLAKLRIPRRIVAILEGESLVNDATALVAYRLALSAVVAGGFSFAEAGMDFVVKSLGGIAIGWLAGLLVAWVRPRIRDRSVETVVSLLTPFIAYLPAEWLHLSSVLAVVTTGVYISRRMPQISTPRMRLRAYAVWETLVFLLNGLVFILIGLQLPVVVRGLSADVPIGRLVGYAAAISLVCVVVRLLWVFPATYLPRLLFRRVRRRDPVPPAGQVFVVAWTGMRGIVSLAAALALPLAMPERNLILFITFGVILVTLVGQGLTLAPLIRRLRLTADRDEEVEEVTARHLGALAALERLDQLAAADGETAPMLGRLRATYDERIAFYSSRLIDTATGPDDGDDARGSNGDRPIAIACTSNEQVLREALAAERRMLVKLRDDGVIGDEVMRRVQEELDLEESKLGD